MTDTELYQIVKDHREAWPEVFETLTMPSGRVFIVCGDRPPIGVEYCDEDSDMNDEDLLAFEASFHRAILARTHVSVDKWPEGYIVRVQSHSFESPRLIEAYAKALEWLK